MTAVPKIVLITPTMTNLKNVMSIIFFSFSNILIPLYTICL